jgi:hypothetical protein
MIQCVCRAPSNVASHLTLKVSIFYRAPFVYEGTVYVVLHIFVRRNPRIIDFRLLQCGAAVQGHL